MVDLPDWADRPALEITMPVLLSQRQAADLLCLSERTLERWRVTGCGPAYVKLGGRRVAYREVDLVEFINLRRRTSTSERRP